MCTDELEEQRKRLMAGGRSAPGLREPSSVEPGGPGGEHDNPPIPLRPKSIERLETWSAVPDNSEKVLTVSVDEDTYHVLKAVAERNRLSIGTLLREVLASYVKYK
jgi:hypothetical protein